MMRRAVCLLVWIVMSTGLSARELLFPHYGDGGGLSMVFSISNLAGGPAQGWLRFFDSQGNPQTLPLTTGEASVVPLQMAPHSTLLVATEGSSNPPRSGYAVLELDQASVSAVAFFGFASGGEAAIFPAEQGEEFQLFVEVVGSVNTGVAAVHDSAEPLEARLYDQAGQLVGETEVPFTGRHSAKLLSDLFPALPRPFRGLLELESEEPFAVTALRFGPGLLTSLPLIPTDDADDFGAEMEDQLQRRSLALFGIQAPLADRAREPDYVPRQDAGAGQRQLLARGLTAEYVTRNVGARTEQMILYPDDVAPTHLIVCAENGRAGTTPGGNRGLNASVQRVSLASGEVENVLLGLDLCDGVRRTSWGTVLVTEETFDGRAYEILDPLATTGHWVADRASGDVRMAIDSLEVSTRAAQRPALPTLTWEGLAVLPSGVVIGTEELIPGRLAPDSDGGGIFKFVPEAPRSQDGPIPDLSASPLVSGRSFALQVSCRGAGTAGFPQYGQGCEVGNAVWVEVDPLQARSDASARGATGYHRAEDLESDPGYSGPGIRFCFAVSGQDLAEDWGQVLCGVDPNPSGDGIVTDTRTGLNYLADSTHESGYAVSVVDRFFLGAPGFHSADNLAFQPGFANLFILEDARFGEVFSCLPDGEDRDMQTDGCVRVLSIIDPEAEPTGLVFEANGQTAYYIVGRGEQPESMLDFQANPFDGLTSDLIRITGFRAAADDR